MWTNQQLDIAIGIDSGTNTGFAIWSKKEKRFIEVSTMKIHRALDKVKDYHKQGYTILVIVEDARKAVFGRSEDYHKAQGAGSVKRDASIWEDFLKDHNIKHIMQRPMKAKTKIDAVKFRTITKYTGLTSEHSRDAAMLVYGL